MTINWLTKFLSKWLGNDKFTHHFSAHFLFQCSSIRHCCYNCVTECFPAYFITSIWAPSSEFVSSSIPSWQGLTAHAQPFREARYLAFCLKVPLDSLLVWASSGGSGETARMCRLAWTFAARTGDKYQIRLTRSICTENQDLGEAISKILY